MVENSTTKSPRGEVRGCGTPLLFNCLIFDNFKEKMAYIYLKFGLYQRAIDGK